jgi:hypothetical protein
MRKKVDATATEPIVEDEKEEEKSLIAVLEDSP